MQFFGRLGQIGEIPNVAPHSLLLYRRLGCVPRYLGTLPCATLFFANNSNDEEGRCHGRTSVCVIHTNYGGYIKLAVQWSFSHAYDIQGNSTGATIEFDHEAKRAAVYLDADQVSLAIGKAGSNIKLASRLTGYEIDVYRNQAEYEIDDVDLEEFSDAIEPWVIETFKNIGCDTARQVLELSAEELIRRTDLEEETVRDVLRILSEEFEEGAK